MKDPVCCELCTLLSLAAFIIAVTLQLHLNLIHVKLFNAFQGLLFLYENGIVYAFNHSF